MDQPTALILGDLGVLDRGDVLEPGRRDLQVSGKGAADRDGGAPPQFGGPRSHTTADAVS